MDCVARYDRPHAYPGYSMSDDCVSIRATLWPRHTLQSDDTLWPTTYPPVAVTVVGLENIPSPQTSSRSTNKYKHPAGSKTATHPRKGQSGHVLPYDRSHNTSISRTLRLRIYQVRVTAGRRPIPAVQ